MHDMFVIVRRLPEGVAVAARVVATGVWVELIAAGVVLDDVPRGSLLDVHALVAVGGYTVPFHNVVVAFIGSVAPLAGRIERGQQQRQDER